MSKAGSKGRRLRNARKWLAERDGPICWLCGEDFSCVLSATLDHYIPKSLGGKGTRDNLRLAHKRCNGLRGNTPPEESVALVRQRLGQAGKLMERGIDYFAPRPAKPPIFEQTFLQKLSAQKQDEGQQNAKLFQPV